MNNDIVKTLATLFNAAEGPTINHIEQSEDEVTFALHVPTELRWFEGHFPDQKVLPGVVQVNWACQFANALFTLSGKFKEIANIKFKQVVLPETQMQLRLRVNQEKNKVQFNFFEGDIVFSMGTIKYMSQ